MSKLRLILVLRKLAARAFAAFRDPRVPSRLKWLALGAAMFVLSPLNVLGDLPFLGIADDAALLSLVLVWFTRASAPYVNTIDF